MFNDRMVTRTRHVLFVPNSVRNTAHTQPTVAPFLSPPFGFCSQIRPRPCDGCSDRGIEGLPTCSWIQGERPHQSSTQKWTPGGENSRTGQPLRQGPATHQGMVPTSSLQTLHKVQDAPPIPPPSSPRLSLATGGWGISFPGDGRVLIPPRKHSNSPVNTKYNLSAIVAGITPTAPPPHQSSNRTVNPRPLRARGLGKESY